MGMSRVARLDCVKVYRCGARIFSFTLRANFSGTNTSSFLATHLIMVKLTEFLVKHA